MEVNKKFMCHVYCGSIPVPQEYNLWWDFEAKHKNLTQLEKSEGKLKAIQTSKALTAQQKIFS